MAIVLVSEVYAQARQLLNEVGGVVYTDSALSGFVKQAYLELQAKLQLNGAQVVQDQVDTALNVTAVTQLSIAFSGTPSVLPVGFLMPIKLYEKDVGVSDSFYIPMYERRMLPYRDQTTSLIDWQWKGNEIEFVGSTKARTVKLTYIRDLAVLAGSPIPGGSALEPLNSLIFMSYRVAALAAALNMENLDRANLLQQGAESALDDLIGLATLSQQGVAVRQRAYSPFRHFIRYITS